MESLFIDRRTLHDRRSTWTNDGRSWRPSLWLLLAALVASPALAGGGTITVGGGCSLADAIRSANADLDIGGCSGAGGDETLVLDQDVVLSSDDPASSLLFETRAGLPDIASSMTIEAGTASRIERDASFACERTDVGPRFRLLNVTGGAEVTLRGLTLVNGCAFGGGAVAVAHASASVVTFEGMTFSGNTALGAIDSGTHPDGVDARGGALVLDGLTGGTVSIVGSTFDGNRALGGDVCPNRSARGGAIDVTARVDAEIEIRDSTVSAGTVAVGTCSSPLAVAAGGGLATESSATLRIHASRFSENDVSGYPSAPALGGAVYAGPGTTVEVDLSVFESGSVYGGDVELSDGPDPTSRGAGGGLYLEGTAAIVSSEILDNVADGGYHGTYFPDIGSFGGGLWIRTGTLRNVLMSDNRARAGASPFGRSNAYGGGLYVAGAVQADGVALLGNGASGIIFRSNGFGGGAFVAAPEGSLQLLSSTVSGNGASGGYQDEMVDPFGVGLGGGLAVADGATLTVESSTVSENGVSSGSIFGAGVGGGLYVEPGAVASLRSTILFGNEEYVSDDSPARDCVGSPQSLGANIVGVTGTCSFDAAGDQIDVDPLIGQLFSYGCVTELPNGDCIPSYRPQPSSPALDQGSCSTDVSTDGRGFERPWDLPSIADFDDACDVGSFETIDRDDDGLDDASELVGTIVVGGGCSLADAIRSANSNMDTGGCTGAGGIETLVLDEDVVLQAADPTSSRLLETRAGLPDIKESMTIQAGAGSRIERDPSFGCDRDDLGPRFRLLNIARGAEEVTLRGLTLANGCAFAGGAVLVHPFYSSHVTIDDVTFTGNTALGAFDSAEHPNGVDARGGALAVDQLYGGGVAILDSTFDGNRAFGGDVCPKRNARGGAIDISNRVDALVEIRDSTVSSSLVTVGNCSSTAARAVGGGLATESSATLRIVSSQFSSNSAAGLSDYASEVLGGAVYGGIRSVVEIDSSSFEGSEALGGGSFANDDPNPPGRGVGGGLYLAGSADIMSSRISENLAAGGFALSVDPGAEGRAGGLWMSSGTLRNVLLRGNEARGGDGSFSPTANAYGGGLFVAGSVEAERVALVENGATARGDGADGFGGGAYVASPDGDLRLLSSTISDNRARGGSTDEPIGEAGGGFGAGIAASALTTLVVDSSTISVNYASGGFFNTAIEFSEGGGIWVDDSASASVRGSILFDNEVLNIMGDNQPDDCAGSPLSLGANFVGEPVDCDFNAAGDQIGVDPLLGALGDHGCAIDLASGGCVPSHPLHPRSPALDQGSCSDDVTNDGRGYERPWDLPLIVDFDDGCDVGSFEIVDRNGDGFDDAVEMVPIFGDGFESGDVTAWSAGVP